jgi:hypothetical protein
VRQFIPRESLAVRLFPAGLTLAVLGFGVYFDHASSSIAAPQQAAAMDRALARDDASPDVRRVAQWAVATQDTAGLPFVVVDNVESRIFAFDPQGRSIGSASVHDGSAPQRAASDSPGRFVADPIASARSGAVVWVSAGRQIAVRSADGNATPPDDASSLEVERAFWIERLAALRTQPSVAYVLPKAQGARRPS